MGITDLLTADPCSWYIRVCGCACEGLLYTCIHPLHLTSDPFRGSVWEEMYCQSWQKMFKFVCFVNCVSTCVCSFSGGVCGRDSFGAGFWGPHGTDRRHSGQALPTDQVALHRAVVDHRPLPISQLALTQSASVCVCGLDHYCSTHIHTPLWLPLCTLTLKGQRITTTDTHTCIPHRRMRMRKTQMHTRDWDKHIRGLNLHAWDPFCHSHLLQFMLLSVHHGL